jgi:hypothetical protein
MSSVQIYRIIAQQLSYSFYDELFISTDVSKFGHLVKLVYSRCDEFDSPLNIKCHADRLVYEALY